MTNSAVLFLTFNRLDTTEKVFEAIRSARPPRLYLASDGPRSSRPSEKVAVEEVRRFMTSHVDWPCEVRTLFRENNLGCKVAVSEGITWFFENEEHGIILEDDCLPHPDFFSFADEMLVRYKDDTGVFSISGTNIKGSISSPASYGFSAFGGIWGWASWRRAWSHYTLNVAPSFTDEVWRGIETHLGSRRLSESVRFVLQKSLIDTNPTTWDYQWLFATLAAKGMCIVPAANLVTNIGFGVQSTHTFDASNPLANMPIHSLPGPYQHPIDKTFDAAYDAYHMSFYKTNALARWKYALKKLLSRKAA